MGRQNDHIVLYLGDVILHNRLLSSMSLQHSGYYISQEFSSRADNFISLAESAFVFSHLIPNKLDSQRFTASYQS